jgi:hypothetical protein
MGIDIEKSSSGALGTFTANVDGTQNNEGGIDAGGPPVFGDVVGGTFVGVSTAAVGSGPFDPSFNNTIYVSQGGTADVFVNAQTQSFESGGNIQAKYKAQKPITNLDPQFLNGSTANFGTNGGTTSTGSVNNGTIHSLEVLTSATSNGGVATVCNTFAIPFANVVVPTGTGFTIHGSISGAVGPQTNFSTSVGFGSGPPPSVLTISLTGTVPASSNVIATTTIIGANGKYVPQSFAVSGAAQTKGYTSVTGWSPTSDEQIYGIDATGETSFNTLLADLNTALAVSNPGATAAAPSGSAAGILAAAGDNIEIIFPTGANPNGNPAIFAYDFSGYTANGTVVNSNVTVVPEPTSIGAMVVGGLGLLSRRRRRRQMA